MDHPLEPVSVAREQLSERLFISARGAPEQVDHLTEVVGLHSVHTLLNAIPGKSSPSPDEKMTNDE